MRKIGLDKFTPQLYDVARIYQMKILLLDPSSVYLNLLKEETVELGTDFFFANHEEEAWTILNDRNINLVISAHQLSNSKGIDFIKRIRAHLNMSRPSSDLPLFLFLSSASASEWETDLLDFPCLGILPRTFEKGELAKKVKYLLQEHIKTPHANILVVDDSVLNRNVISRTLTKKGFRVMEAKDGNQALVMLGEYNNQIDLVISDNYMRIMNGVELFQNMQKIQEYAKIPFILLTGEDDIELNSEWRKIGIKVILTKPHSSEELLFEITKYLLSK